LSGDNKDNCLNANDISNATLENALKKLAKEDHVYIIHDPSDIRKPHSAQLESIGKVRDLDGNIINGYSSFNSVAITPNGKTVTLLNHLSYSNKEPTFLRQEDIKKFEHKKLSRDDENYKNIETRLSSGDFINKNKITTNELKKVHYALKENHPNVKITHIMDREFDSISTLRFIANDLHDDFVIRLKANRVTNDKDDNGKNILLIKSDKFDLKYEINLPKLMIKNKCYQDVKIKLECTDHLGFNVLRAIIYDKKGKSIYKNPILLVTNRKISSVETAWITYVAYLKRGKIEYVFKFIKETLGWENIRLKDLQSIKNMLSICYFVAAYFFEMGDQMAKDDFVIMLADLGGGKGKTTKYYVLKGLSRLLNKYAVDSYIKEHNLTKDDMDELNKYAGIEAKK
jgi:hypothetical protein